MYVLENDCCDVNGPTVVINYYLRYPVRLAGGRWLVLVCSERKVLLAGCWWLICSERKLPLAGWWLISRTDGACTE
jgi:hypothetical protein